MTTEQLIALSHKQAHEAEHDLEDTLMIQLTKREIWSLVYGILWASHIAPDLEDGYADLLEKMSELLDVQKDHWRTNRDDGEAAA